MCLIYEAAKNGSNKMPFEHLYAAESAELVFRRKKKCQKPLSLTLITATSVILLR